MAGPEGERWAPVHGIVRHSKALETIEALSELFETNAADMDGLGVGAGYMFLAVGRTGFLIEPCFYWPDEQWEIHKHFIEDAHFAKLPVHSRNDEARALVEKLARRASSRSFSGRMDGIHFQIGRTYPLKERSDPRGMGHTQSGESQCRSERLDEPWSALGLCSSFFRLSAFSATSA